LYLCFETHVIIKSSWHDKYSKGKTTKTIRGEWCCVLYFTGMFMHCFLDRMRTQKSSGSKGLRLTYSVLPGLGLLVFNEQVGRRLQRIYSSFSSILPHPEDLQSLPRCMSSPQAKASQHSKAEYVYMPTDYLAS
jgi:hypothetical protein